jgi:hypothetical protein
VFTKAFASWIPPHKGSCEVLLFPPDLLIIFRAIVPDILTIHEGKIAIAHKMPIGKGRTDGADLR